MASSEMKQRNDIELRSEKMRNFIGKVPVLLTRISLLVNILVLALLGWGIWYLRRLFNMVDGDDSTFGTAIGGLLKYEVRCQK